MAVSRVGWALGLSIATFLALFAAAGAAFSDRETTPMQGGYQVAPSQPGDRASYSLGMVMADGERGNWVSTGAQMRVQRFPDRVLPDAEGQPRPVQSFLTSWALDGVPIGNDFDVGDFEVSAGPGFEVDSDDWLVAHPDAATGEVVAVTVAPGSPRLDGTLAGDQFEEDSGLLVPDAVTLWEGGPAPCGFQSPLQQGWDLSKPVSIPGECPPGGEVGGAPPPKGRKFLAFAEDQVQEWDATVFASTEDRDAVRLWFAEEVPYPVRMLVRFDLGVPSEYRGSTRIYLLYEMTEFHAGKAVEPPALPKWSSSLAPRQPFGPDESGVQHGFPLSEALQAAKEDRFNPDVQEFFQEHPQAFVDSAHFSEEEGLLLWTLTISGGGEAIEAVVTYDPSVDPAPSPVPLPVPGASPTRTDTGSSPGLHVGAADAPDSFPRVAAVLERWRAARDPGVSASAPAAWSHRIGCAGEPCDAVDAWVAAGAADPLTGRYSFLGLRPDGSLRFLQESPSPYPVPRGEDDYWDWASMDWDDYSDSWDQDPRALSFAYAGAWTFPRASTTGAVGGAALLAGLVYFIWPLAKGTGAIGLFSRIDRDDLLDHPLRADIVQVVGSQPGIHFQELVRRMDKGRGTMEHHLRKLVDGGLLVPQTSSGFTCYFPKGKVDRSVMAAAPVLKSDGARVVLQTIHDNPGIAAQDVAERTGLTPSTVNYHLKRLTQVGLANGQRNGRFLLLTPTMLGQQALGTWGRT